MVTVLVTGVCSPLGSAVLSSLGTKDWVDRVIGVDAGPLAVSAPKLRFVRTDLENEDLSGLFAGVDAVVHLMPRASTNLLMKVMEAATRSGVTHLMVPSSASVFGAWPTNAVPLPEDAPLRPNPGFSYAVTLAEHERRVAAWRIAHPQLRVAVMRFALMLGGGLEQAFSDAFGGVEADRQLHGNRPVQFLHIDDAVSAVVLAVHKQLDGTFNVGPKNFVGNETVRAVAGVLPRPPLPVRVGYVVNKARWRRRYRSDFADAMPYFVYPWVMSSDRLQAEGWKPSYTSEEAVVAGAAAGWWGRLTPSSRRAVITGAAAGGIALGNIAVLAALLLARRRVR